jgi:phosphoribosylformylglycinamidine cyclo-ligase
MAVGRVALDRIIVGRDLQPGDVVIGLESSGIHSNGLTLARRTFFEKAGLDIGHKFADLDCALGEELLKPTLIYVPEVLDILAEIPDVKSLANITSDGFLNLVRADAPVGFVLDALPEPQPIFRLIQHYGAVDVAEMHQVYNMGVGFCVVVPETAVDRTLRILKTHGRKAQAIGRAVADSEKRVRIPERGLEGQGKFFRRLA